MITNNSTKHNIRYYLILLAILSLALFFFFKYKNISGEVEDSANQKISRTEVEHIVKDTLEKNPELIVNSLQKWTVQQEKNAFDEIQNKVMQFKGRLEENVNDPRAGNVTNASIKMVSFFDYSCGYCRRMLPIEEKLLATNNDLQIIYKPIPILGEGSVLAIRAALAANLIDQSKFMKMHTALFNQKGARTMESILDLAGTASYDVAVFRTKMADPIVEKTIQETMNIANDIGIRSTPTFIINGKLIPGAANFEDMNALIAEQRKQISTAPAPAATNESPAEVTVDNKPAEPQAANEVETKAAEDATVAPTSAPAEKATPAANEGK